MTGRYEIAASHSRRMYSDDLVFAVEYAEANRQAGTEVTVTDTHTQRNVTVDTSRIREI